MADAIPTGIPPDTATATRDTQAAPWCPPQQLLPDQLVGALLDTAHDAFTSGFTVVAGVSDWNALC
jgi:hypothetical protein